jgi:hypothetical protein
MVRKIRVVVFMMALMGMAVPVRAQAPVPIPLEGTSLDVDVYGNTFVVDSRNSTLALYDRAMRKIASTGGPGWEQGRFDQPAGLWARNGLDVYVADYGNHRIQRFDRTLNFVSSFSSGDDENVSERFGHPSDVVLSRLGDLYICDTENECIVKVNSASRAAASFGGFGAGQGRLQHPIQVEIGANDWVYVLDPPRVIVFDGFGNFLSTLPDGVLSHPTGLFADTKGIMVVDGDSLFCFDAAHHMANVFSLAALTGRRCANVTSFVVAGGSLYVLCADGLSVTPDPRE